MCTIVCRSFWFSDYLLGRGDVLHIQVVLNGGVSFGFLIFVSSLFITLLDADFEILE